MTDRWEYCVIGTAIASPEKISEAEDLLPSDFTGENVGVWAEILNLSQRESLSARSLIEQLRSSGINNPERIINDALEYRGDTMKLFVDRVIEASTRRALRRNAALIAAEADDTSTNISQVLERAEQNIMSLRRQRAEGLSMADLVSVFIPRVNGIRAGTFKPAWEPKLAAIKNIISFCEAEDFVVIAARPGEGKSAYMKFEAFHLANRGQGVLIINKENAPIEYIRSFIALDTGIDSEKLKAAKLLTEQELAEVKASAERMSHLPIYIETAANADEAVQKIRKYKADKNITLAVVDYIQLIYNNIQRRVDDISYTTGKLKEAANTIHVPILAAAQLSRDIERRGADSEPQLADLRDSGSIEQDATIVAFPRIFWVDPSPQQIAMFPENIDQSTRQIHPQLKAVPVRFFIRKNRNGRIGTSDMVKWTKSTNNYQTLVRDYENS